MKIRTALAAVSLVLLASSAQSQVLPDNWCKDVHIRFFVGGAEGDGFATIVYNGAKQARSRHRARRSTTFSPAGTARRWCSSSAKRSRQAGRHRHDGPSRDAAIMPLAEEAAKAGILMMYQNVDVPKVGAKFGGGYVGAQLEPQGRALGAEAVQAAPG